MPQLRGLLWVPAPCSSSRPLGACALQQLCHRAGALLPAALQPERAAPSAADLLASEAPCFFSRLLHAPEGKLKKSIHRNILLQVKTLQHVGGLFVRRFGAAAVGKGDARQHLLAADHSDEDRPWLRAEKILTAAAPWQVVCLILLDERDSTRTTGTLSALRSSSSLPQASSKHLVSPWGC